MWSVYTHLGIYFTHCEYCLLKRFWYYILPNKLKVSRYLYIYIKHSNFYKKYIYIYTYTKNHNAILLYIIYHVLNLLIRVYVSKVLRATLGIIDLLHAFFLGVPTFQLLETWKQDPKMLTPRVRLRSGHLEVDGRYCWWFRNPARNPVEVGSFSDFYRVFIHLWLFGFFPSTVALEITLFPIGKFWLLTWWVFDPAMLPKRDLP